MISITRRAFGTVFVGSAMLAGTLPGLAADAALIEAAKREGSVIWYTSLIVDQAVRPIAEAFEANYGIKVEFSRAQGPDTVLKLVQEAQAGNIQVDVTDTTLAGVAALPTEILSDFPGTLESVVPEQDRVPGGFWVPITQYYSTGAINTELVAAEDAPKTFDDLLDPKWQGKMVWHGTPDMSGPPGFIGNVLLTMGEEAGMAYLDKLAAQKIAVVPGSQRAVLDQVIAGEYPLQLMAVTHHAAISQARGAPVEWMKLEPLVGTRSYVGLVKDSKSPNAGKLLVDFILSDEGQAVLSKANYIPASVNVEALTPELKPEVGQFEARVMTPDIAREQLPRWIEIFRSRFM